MPPLPPGRRRSCTLLSILLACAACGEEPAPGSDPERVTPQAAVAASEAWFEDATDELGVAFTYDNGALPAAGGADRFDLPGVMGGGVALFDADGNGDLDLYFVNGHANLAGGHANLAGEARLPAEPSVNRLLIQRDARFVDATAGSGLGDPGYGMGVAVGDVDRDGDLDVYVTNLGPDRLFLNRGDGRFDDATDAWGAAVDGWSSSAAFFDYDGDGWLDLYVARYVRWDPELDCRGFFDQPDWCGPRMFEPEHDVLLLNQAGRGFVNVSERVGLAVAPAPSLGVACADFTGDGRTDVFVANDAAPNQLWARSSDGRLEDRAPRLGLDLDGAGAPEAGMGAVAAPWLGSERLGLLLTHLRDETNTLYLSVQGEDGRAAGFEDATDRSGLARASAPFTGFGAVPIDLELDGDLDLVVANGGVNRGEPSPYSNLRSPWNELAEPDHLFLDRNGRFEPAAELGGPLCHTARISRGLAAGDLDGDGDLDLVVTALLEPARVLRNRAPRTGSRVVVRVLEAPGPGGARADALGATVRLSAGGRTRVRAVTRAVGYLSSSPPELCFGLGEVARYDGIEVTWADGSTTGYPGGPANGRIVTLARKATVERR